VAVVTTAMPLGLAFGFAMVGFFFEDLLPHEQYSSWHVNGFYLRICLSAYLLGKKKHKKKSENTKDTIRKKIFATVRPCISYRCIGVSANKITA
jgi:hypothetical protein